MRTEFGISPGLTEIEAYSRLMFAAERFRSSRPSVVLPEPPTSGELAIDLPTGAHWGVVLSHDVDHLGLREHLIDGFLARYAANIARQNLVGRFRPIQALDNYWGIVQAAFGHDRWDAIEDLLACERRLGVRSTWFVPVRRGAGIAFDLPRAAALARTLHEAGIEVGLHGQSPDSAREFASEAEDLGKAIGAPVIGCRMHYLRLTRAALDGFEAAGIRYDSTVMERQSLHPDEMPLPAPRLARPRLMEIPLHVMDSTLFSTTGLGLNLVEARDYTARLIARARREERVLVINLHPNFYSQQNPEIRDWYDDLLHQITRTSDGFITDFRGLLPRIRRS